MEIYKEKFIKLISEEVSLKSILITGASSGIGESTSVLLSNSGYNVFAGVRSIYDYKRFEELNNPNLKPIILDVSKSKDIEAAYYFVKDSVGEKGLMALINNAGNSYTTTTEYFNETNARQLLETHFWGMANLIKKFLPLLRIFGSSNPNKARIINVGSIGSISAFPFLQFYNAAKFSILGFSESLNYELGPLCIKTIVMIPGSIKTLIWKKNNQSTQDSISLLDEIGVFNYSENIKRASKLSMNIENNAIHPDKAAIVFKKALEARNPSFKYFIGIDAKIVNILVKYFSDKFRQIIISRQLNFIKPVNKL